MDIVFKAPDGVNSFMVKSDGQEYELFKKATAEKSKNGKEIKNEWISLRRYFYTLPAAVYAALDMCLKSDDGKIVVEADKARIALGKILREKTDKIAETIEVR